MATKQMMFDTEARAEIFDGMSQLSRAVKVTLGPRGRNVVLHKSYGSPRITKDGVTVDKGKTTDSTLEYTEGMQFDKGYLSPYFLTNPTTLETVLENAKILLHEKKINNLAELLPLLNKIVTAGVPLLIISEDVESEALAALVVNKLRGVLSVAAVKAPGFGDRRKAIMADLAVLTGGQFVSED